MWIIGIIIVIFIIYAIAQSAIENSVTTNNIENNKKEIQKKEFNTSKVNYFNGISYKWEIRLDLDNQQIAICNTFPTGLMKIIKFSDIIECEIIEDADIIMKGGVGRAIVGGVIAGGVGAIVGANTRKSKNIVRKLMIRIITKHINNSLCTIDLINTETKKDSIEYRDAIKFANDVYAIITSIISKNKDINEENKNKQIKTITENSNLVEQLERLSKLKSEEMITEEEFKKSKKRIFSNKETTEVTNEDVETISDSKDDEIITEDSNYDSEIKKMYNLVDKDAEDIKYFMQITQCTLENAIYEKVASMLQDDYDLSYEQATKYIKDYREKHEK